MFNSIRQLLKTDEDLSIDIQEAKSESRFDSSEELLLQFAQKGSTPIVVTGATGFLVRLIESIF